MKEFGPRGGCTSLAPRTLGSPTDLHLRGIFQHGQGKVVTQSGGQLYFTMFKNRVV